MALKPNPLRVADGLRCSRLTPEQARKLHEAGMTIIERTGVRFYDQEALDLLRKAGLTVEEDARVRIPPRLVEWAMAAAPKSVTLYDRYGEPAIQLDGHCAYFGTGSDCLNIRDHRTGERRKPVLQDVVEGITLCDALDNVDFVMSMFLPGDVPGEIADRFQMEIMLNYTAKPLLVVNYEPAGCVDATEMAQVVAGGARALAEKPFIANYINITTGLRQNAESLQKLLYLVEQGVPVIYISGASGALTGPVTPAGNMALRHGGDLAGLVLAQLKREGAPFIMSGYADTTLDMRTLIMPYAEPEPRGGLASVCHQYHLPMFTTGGCTDAKLVDQQAVIEAALTLATDALTGGHLVHDMGYLETGLCGSLALLVICDEILNWIKQWTAPLEVSDETLALDLIDEVGPDGGFLETEHTRRHYKEHWYPRLFERGNYESWAAKGSQTLGQRAAERVDKILATHQAGMRCRPTWRRGFTASCSERRPNSREPYPARENVPQVANLRYTLIVRAVFHAAGGATADEDRTTEARSALSIFRNLRALCVSVVILRAVTTQRSVSCPQKLLALPLWSAVHAISSALAYAVSQRVGMVGSAWQGVLWRWPRPGRWFPSVRKRPVG